jgi:hydrogenase-4 component B
MSNVAPLFLAFFLLCGFGAVVAFLAPRRRRPELLAGVGAVASLAILAASSQLLVDEASLRIVLWPVLGLGTMTLGADRLSALFLFIAGAIYLPVSLFSGSYLKKYSAHDTLRYFSVLYHGLFASIVLTLIADDAISFLIAWEAMSIISFLLVTYEYENDESSRAAFIMLAMSEAGAIVVALAFLLAGTIAGGLGFATIRSASALFDQNTRGAIFLLSFSGFAVKAGLVPVNSWLALAHPVAPTNISALLSTIIVNLGIYGIVRFNLDLTPIVIPGPGLVVLVVGSISALIGILYATIQAEMKRLLAHSTIENMGIVAAGLGAAMVFLASDQRVVGGIALVAAFYHLLNHSVYKALLFLGCGAVEAGAGTRDLDRLGGLARRMPWTSALFLVGVLSISALPPLNGFVSEWLTLQTILRSALLSAAPVKIIFAVSGALLALTAGLAVTCFAKVFSMGFLGMPRSEGAAKAIESRLGMRAPLVLLAASCIALGILPTYIIPTLDGATAPFTHASATSALVPPFFDRAAQREEALKPTFLSEFHDLGANVGSRVLPGRGLVVLHRGEERNPVVFAMSTTYMAVVLAALLAAIFVVFRALTGERSLDRRPAWDGGLRRLWPNTTYTATGFSNPVRVVFQGLLRPSGSEESTEAVAQHFRTAISREYREDPVVDRVMLGPPVQALRDLATVVRRMHVGHVNAYAAYVLIAMLFVLLVGIAL